MNLLASLLSIRIALQHHVGNFMVQKRLPLYLDYTQIWQTKQKRELLHEVKSSTPLIAMGDIESPTILDVEAKLLQSCPSYKH